MVAVMVGLAGARVLMHGAPATGSALYWLYTATTVAFGLMLKGYRMDFAIAAFQMRNRLRLQAVTDGLTGLINREGWNREAAAAYMSAHEGARALSFAFFDIDHFKAVNDTHGHDAGDRVLQALGRILRERADRECISARLGGEEFVVLYAGCTPAQAKTGCGRYAKNSNARWPRSSSRSRSVRASPIVDPPNPWTGTCAAPTSRCTKPSAPAATGWWSATCRRP